MDLYVWAYVTKVTGHYHDEGAVMVAAASLEEARDRVAEHIENRDSDLFTTEPSYVLPLAGESDVIAVFADAGCC